MHVAQSPGRFAVERLSPFARPAGLRRARAVAIWQERAALVLTDFSGFCRRGTDLLAYSRAPTHNLRTPAYSAAPETMRRTASFSSMRRLSRPTKSIERSTTIERWRSSVTM